MAVSPTFHQGFPEDSSWWIRTPRPDVEFPVSQGSCSMDKISVLIEKPERARVIAALALNLFVFENKRHASRERLNCPFHCKEGFSNAAVLMQHVLECRRFSTDEVYCNCCGGFHSFSDNSQNDRFCGDDDSASPLIEKPRKNSTVRKLTHSVTDFFSRSRSASRASLRGFEHPVSPTSTTFRRQSTLAMTPTPSPSSAPRKQPVSCVPESSGSAHEMDHLSSVLCEVSGPDVTRAELPGSELSNVAVPSSSRRSNSTISALSLETNCARGPTFFDAQVVTESPTEDLSMDAMLQGMGAATSQDLAASHARFPSTGTSQPMLQYQGGQHRQSSLDLVQPHMFQVDLQLSPPSTQEGLYPTGGAGVAVVPQSFCFQTPNWQAPSRHGSGDSHFSDGSWTLAGSGSPGSSTGQAQQQVFMPGVLLGASPNFGAPLEEGDEFKCQLCGYRPSGKRSGWKQNFKKHLRNHESDRIPCPDCKKPLKRIDNVRHHQKHACPKRRLFGSAFQRTRRHEEEMVEYEWIDGRHGHPKRLRQDSTGAWQWLHAGRET
ncbi:hypothetical protein FALBO_3012 [Fusarium albosuccineum]|uniref:C2H2-type domain-containing protein n=1 Tax=Fusarium albosuccineum TaxID=1237068 RepID=A0A8H4LJU4_9HYPO|nr:hypothetical protein FALBO_3012 [Fusarium albosuccineum]